MLGLDICNHEFYITYFYMWLFYKLQTSIFITPKHKHQRAHKLYIQNKCPSRGSKHQSVLERKYRQTPTSTGCLCWIVRGWHFGCRTIKYNFDCLRDVPRHLTQYPNNGFWIVDSVLNCNHAWLRILIMAFHSVSNIPFSIIFFYIK